MIESMNLPWAFGSKGTRSASADNLNQVLADSMTLRDLYKKHHWRVTGPDFYQLHLLFDKHHAEQSELVDQIAERIMTLGGVSLAMSADVAEVTIVPRPSKGREGVPVQMLRLLHAHSIIIEESRAMGRQAVREGDEGNADLFVTDVIRRNELQAWFISAHLFETPRELENAGVNCTGASRDTSKPWEF